MKPLLLLVVALTFLSESAQAYPEMIRHGYGTCFTCHNSPDGGGVLTSYGRALSKELLSTWGREGEERFLYAVETPEWLQPGGNFRYARLNRKFNNLSQTRSVVMEADLEAAVHVGKISVQGTFGYSDAASIGDGLISRRHFVLFRPNEQVFLRAGRFARAFGINVADHIVETKRGLGFDARTETYNLELAYIKEPFELFATAIAGRPDKEAEQAEKGAALRASIQTLETYKLGASYYFGTNDFGKRHLYGLFAMIGFTPRLYLLFEADLQSTLPNGANQQLGFADYARLGFEVVQGFHLNLVQQAYIQDYQTPVGRRTGYGGGLQWFPRPHFEITANYERQRINDSSDADSFWTMFHYYL